MTHEPHADAPRRVLVRTAVIGLAAVWLATLTFAFGLVRLAYVVPVIIGGFTLMVSAALHARSIRAR